MLPLPLNPFLAIHDTYHMPDLGRLQQEIRAVGGQIID